MDLDEKQDKSISQTSLKTFDSSGIVIIPSNPRRLALVIQPAASGPINLRIGVQTNAGGTILILPGDLPVMLTVRDHGDLARRESYITGSVGDTFLYSESLCGCG